MRRLIMFTAAYPYEQMNSWKGQELEVFRKYFDDIYVAPLYQREPNVSADLPKGVRVLPAPFPLGHFRESRARRIANLIGRRLRDHVRLREDFPSFSAVRRYWGAAADVEQILRSPAWKEHIAPLLPGSTLYFFWGRGYAAVLPYLSSHSARRSLVRMHRWDLYPDVNNGYIPFQRRIVETAGVIAPVSRSGVDLLTTLYPSHSAKFRCLRLGTEPQGQARPSHDGRFRIVSCAYARPVKRLHLIVEALHHLDFPVTWTHIGDGPQLSEIRMACRGLPASVEVHLLGKVAPADVPRIYADSCFDVFLNVSESEGVPVSIMEAMGAGIPAIVTEVGGNGEIVDDTVGVVVGKNVSGRALAQVIAKLRQIPCNQQLAMREACRHRVQDDYDLSRNARAVAETLWSLSEEGRNPVSDRSTE